MPSRSTRTPIRNAAKSATGSFLSRPSAAQISPSTPDLDGSNCVSRSSKRLVVPQDCIGPCKRSNNVAISNSPVFSDLALCPGGQIVDALLRYTLLLWPRIGQVEVAPCVTVICIGFGKVFFIRGQRCHGKTRQRLVDARRDWLLEGIGQIEWPAVAQDDANETGRIVGGKGILFAGRNCASHGLGEGLDGRKG